MFIVVIHYNRLYGLDFLHHVLRGLTSLTTRLKQSLIGARGDARPGATGTVSTELCRGRLSDYFNVWSSVLAAPTPSTPPLRWWQRNQYYVPVSTPGLPTLLHPHTHAYTLSYAFHLGLVCAHTCALRTGLTCILLEHNNFCANGKVTHHQWFGFCTYDAPGGKSHVQGDPKYAMNSLGNLLCFAPAYVSWVFSYAYRWIHFFKVLFIIMFQVPSVTLI